MNYIFIEGLAVYVFVFLVVALALIGIVGLWYGVSGDIKRDKLKDELYREREKVISRDREIMRLKLKYGELRAGEKVDV